MCDPDELAEIPNRELLASLKLIESLARAMDDDPEFSDALGEALEGIDEEQVSSLPEVGPVDNSEQLRLHFHRLSERLRRFAPSIEQPLPAPPVTQSTTGPAGVRTRKPSRSAAIVTKNDQDLELMEGFVWWDDITEQDVTAYEAELEAASNERPMQKFLANNPRLLVQHMHGGHGRWVLSQKRLGSQYVTDFLIAERSSSGFEWEFVELQSPVAGLFVPSSGRQSEQLDEGIRQVQEWRRWLGGNRDYARKSRAEDGLGLPDVTAGSPGLLLIGREENLTELDRQRRRQLDEDLNIRIHTYDWLIRSAKTRIEALRNLRQQGT